VKVRASTATVEQHEHIAFDRRQSRELIVHGLEVLAAIDVVGWRGDARRIGILVDGLGVPLTQMIHCGAPNDAKQPWTQASGVA